MCRILDRKCKENHQPVRLSHNQSHSTVLCWGPNFRTGKEAEQGPSPAGWPTPARLVGALISLVPLLVAQRRCKSSATEYRTLYIEGQVGVMPQAHSTTTTKIKQKQKQASKILLRPPVRWTECLTRSWARVASERTLDGPTPRAPFGVRSEVRLVIVVIVESQGFYNTGFSDDANSTVTTRLGVCVRPTIG